MHFLEGFDWFFDPCKDIIWQFSKAPEMQIIFSTTVPD